MEDLEAAAAPVVRHAPGTWKVWENLWFYATKNPTFLDCKVWVKHVLRTPSGLGVTNTSRTLTPRKYGDTYEDPWRCMILVRAWCVWRVKRNGWCFARDCRRHEVLRQEARLEEEMRSAQAGAGPPMFGNDKCQELLEELVPEILARVLP
jgi:hypothetical protein